MKRYIFVFLIVLACATSCTWKDSPPATIPAASVMPNTDSPSITSYTDHVPPNPEVMGIEERKKLSPVGQELVAMLDDFVYTFNHNVPQKEGDKFAAVDPASTGIPNEWPTPGKHHIKIKVLPEFGFTDLRIAGDVELRYNATDTTPFWKGSQLFIFSVNPSSQLVLGYWNSSVK